jgi:hypothetical protein
VAFLAQSASLQDFREALAKKIRVPPDAISAESLLGGREIAPYLCGLAMGAGGQPNVKETLLVNLIPGCNPVKPLPNTLQPTDSGAFIPIRPSGQLNPLERLVLVAKYLNVPTSTTNVGYVVVRPESLRPDLHELPDPLVFNLTRCSAQYCASTVLRASTQLASHYEVRWPDDFDGEQARRLTELETKLKEVDEHNRRPWYGVHRTEHSDIYVVPSLKLSEGLRLSIFICPQEHIDLHARLFLPQLLPVVLDLDNCLVERVDFYRHPRPTEDPIMFKLEHAFPDGRNYGDLDAYESAVKRCRKTAGEETKKRLEATKYGNAGEWVLCRKLNTLSERAPKYEMRGTEVVVTSPGMISRQAEVSVRRDLLKRQKALATCVGRREQEEKEELKYLCEEVRHLELAVDEMTRRTSNVLNDEFDEVRFLLLEDTDKPESRVGYLYRRSKDRAPTFLIKPVPGERPYVLKLRPGASKLLEKKESFEWLICTRAAGYSYIGTIRRLLDGSYVTSPDQPRGEHSLLLAKWYECPRVDNIPEQKSLKKMGEKLNRKYCPELMLILDDCEEGHAWTFVKGLHDAQRSNWAAEDNDSVVPVHAYYSYPMYEALQFDDKKYGMGEEGYLYPSQDKELEIFLDKLLLVRYNFYERGVNVLDRLVRGEKDPEGHLQIEHYISVRKFWRNVPGKHAQAKPGSPRGGSSPPHSPVCAVRSGRTSPNAPHRP